MISPADIFCLALIGGLMVLEGNRGVVPALVDFLCVLVTIILARSFYVPLSENMQPSMAYTLILGISLALTVLLSVYVSKRLNVDVTPVEAAIGAGFGISTAVLLSIALFDWLSIRYGGGVSLLHDSLIYWAVTEFAGLREVIDFFGRLTGR
ncbi:MAG: hypothetical protein ACOCX2_08525 [Armatimonadota bacterium]